MIRIGAYTLFPFGKGIADLPLDHLIWWWRVERRMGYVTCMLRFHVGAAIVLVVWVEGLGRE